MIKRLLLFTAMSLPLLSGCSLSPNREAPVIEAPDQWQATTETVQPSTQPALSETTETSLTPWWHNLNDPLLNQLVEQALKANPDLLTAQSAIRKARAYRIQAEGALYPTVTLGADASRNYLHKTETTTDAFSLGFDAAWELDFFGKNANTYTAAEAQEKASQADYADIAISLSAELANNYITLRNAQAQLKLTQTTLQSWQETSQLAEWQAQAGLVSQLDVEQAHRSYEQTKASLPEFELSITESQHQLALLLGQQPSALPETTQNQGVLPVSPSLIQLPIPAEVLRQRPDVRAAEQNVLAAMAQTDSAKANRLPGFSLSGNIGLNSSTLENLFSIDAWGSTLALGLVQTLFDHGQLQAQVDIQHEQEVQAILSYRQTILEALQETENALSGIQRSQEILDALDKALFASEEEVKLSTLLYQTGEIDFFSVLTAQRTRLSLRQQMLNAQTTELSNVITLTKSIMGGWAWQRVQQLSDNQNQGAMQ